MIIFVLYLQNISKSNEHKYNYYIDYYYHRDKTQEEVVSLYIIVDTIFRSAFLDKGKRFFF
ncbi:hypothetical protein SPHINGO8BC_150045 [Sphingobacterium multivorum]|uniref:Uncharacterized protein n=1 Tax=Sphingobacterium multivorum TaxID=28454 RepID=A0A653ZWH6_SPHMU|nr:hypothetical protein SPHINGO8BC_150045 [Sphingobacterium multivorum]